MQLTVLFFAALKEYAGRERLHLQLPHSQITVQDLKAHLASHMPQLAPALARSLAAANHEFVFDEDYVHDGDEVALFPPVSGGNSTPGKRFIQITFAPLDINACVQAITQPTTGAVCIFTGTVRGVTHHKATDEITATLYLEYEAYHPMAIAKLEQVAGEITSRWPQIEGIALVQRLGRLPVGTPTTLVACAAARRHDGVFAATRYGIERLKEIVPVWKKEIGPHSAKWVTGEYRPTPDDQSAMSPPHLDEKGQAA